MSLFNLDELSVDPIKLNNKAIALYFKAGGFFYTNEKGNVTILDSNIRTQQDKVADYIVKTSEMDGIFTNSGDADAIIFTLPNALDVLGRVITFVKVADFNLTVQAVGSNVIANSSIGGSIANTTAGDINTQITLQAYEVSKNKYHKEGRWLIKNAFGVWATS